MFKVKDETARATVYIYGTIGEDWWSPDDENRAKEFAQTLDRLSPKPLDIRIDSSGGDVYEGFAIASAIQRYEGETHAYIDGLAASAASYIAVMADKVTMSDYAMIMIHNAWCLTMGNRDELREAADRLEALDGTIAGIIASRCSMDPGEVAAAMAAETWYSAEEARAAGMCDEVVETAERMAASLDRRVAARCRNVPGCVTLVDNGGETLTALGPDDVSAPVAQTAAEPSGEGESHAGDSITSSEQQGGEAVLLGNRIYRKEQ